MFIARQGDILIVSGAVPESAVPVEAEGGKLILARGEVTGHHHAVLEREATLFRPGEASELADSFLRVRSGGAVLTHQEHASIAIPAGDYIVRRQVEWTPKEVVRVAD